MAGGEELLRRNRADSRDFSCAQRASSVTAPTKRDSPIISTVRRADVILLMEDGRIMERGSHEELMAARGKYYEMVMRQMEAAADESATGVLQ